MVKKLGVDMDSNNSLTNQLKLAIRRRDVASVKRILQLTNNGSYARIRKRNQPEPQHQLLLTLAQLLNEDRS